MTEETSEIILTFLLFHSFVDGACFAWSVNAQPAVGVENGDGLNREGVRSVGGGESQDDC